MADRHRALPPWIRLDAGYVDDDRVARPEAGAGDKTTREPGDLSGEPSPPPVRTSGAEGAGRAVPVAMPGKKPPPPGCKKIPRHIINIIPSLTWGITKLQSKSQRKKQPLPIIKKA